MELKLGVMPVLGGTGAADPAATARFVRLIEDLGCESVWAVEHVVVPDDYTSAYPYDPGGRMSLGAGDDIPDPLHWLTFAAAHTTRLRLGTAMLILPEHHPVDLAKRLATVDVLSGGRLLAGIGVGWLREEYDAVGVPFEERGARADEYLAAMHALWTQAPASYTGRFVSFRDVHSRPGPPGPAGCRSSSAGTPWPPCAAPPASAAVGIHSASPATGSRNCGPPSSRNAPPPGATSRTSRSPCGPRATWGTWKHCAPSVSPGSSSAPTPPTPSACGTRSAGISERCCEYEIRRHHGCRARTRPGPRARVRRGRRPARRQRPRRRRAAEVAALTGAVAFPGDIADWDFAAALIGKAVAEHGRLDALVNNAGLARDRMVVNLAEDEWDAVMRVNLKGTAAPLRHAAAHWRARSKAGEDVAARVVNTTSGAGLMGSIGQASYSAAKAGIAALTQVAAAELARYGVTVNAIAPSARTRDDRRGLRRRHARPRQRLRRDGPRQRVPAGRLARRRRQRRRHRPRLRGLRRPRQRRRRLAARRGPRRRPALAPRRARPRRA